MTGNHEPAVGTINIKHYTVSISLLSNVLQCGKCEECEMMCGLSLSIQAAFVKFIYCVGDFFLFFFHSKTAGNTFLNSEVFIGRWGIDHVAALIASLIWIP